jgi:hypothetical protein
MASSPAALLQNDLRTWCSFGFEYQIRLYPQRINYVNRFQEYYFLHFHTMILHLLFQHQFA